MRSVAWDAIARLYEDVTALYGSDTVLDGHAKPRVTLDLPGSDPEPFHVFVWGTPRDFDVAGMLTGSVVLVTFHIWLTCIASGSTAEDAAACANRYQAIAMQVPLCDVTLGGAVRELGAPQVREAEAWADPDGKRHAGFLLEYEASVPVSADAECLSIIEGINE